MRALAQRVRGERGNVRTAAGVHLGVLAAGLAALLSAAPAAPAFGQEGTGIRAKHMLRFEFDNDTIFESDDAFSAGWSLQLYSPIHDSWDETLPGWIGRLPGLGDDGEGGRVVRWAAGISQLMVTPHDITIAGPQPDDSPWAGILGVYGSLSSSDHHRPSYA